MCCPSGRAVGTIPTANACVPPGVQVSGGTSKFAHGVADSTIGESTKRRGGPTLGSCKRAAGCGREVPRVTPQRAAAKPVQRKAPR